MILDLMWETTRFPITLVYSSHGENLQTNSHINKFPLEKGEEVWIVQDGYRAPLGPFIIVSASQNDLFELKWKNTESMHSELVEGKYLKRDPYLSSS